MAEVLYTRSAIRCLIRCDISLCHFDSPIRCGIIHPGMGMIGFDGAG